MVYRAPMVSKVGCNYTLNNVYKALLLYINFIYIYAILCKNGFCWGPFEEPQWFVVWLWFGFGGQSLPPIAVFGAPYARPRQALQLAGSSTHVAERGALALHLLLIQWVESSPLSYCRLFLENTVGA